MSARLGHNPAKSPKPSSSKRNVDIPSGHDAFGSAMELWNPAQLAHDEVMVSNTGWELDPIRWAKRASAARVLEAQTKHIAAALMRAGEPVVREGDVTLISAVTGIIEQLPVYSACRILPTIAGRERRPMVNGLKLFLSKSRKAEYTRYAVFTSEKPVPVGEDLRGAIQALSRRISKWAHKVSKPANKKGYDMTVLFRGIEFTRKTAEERGMADRYPADTILYHVHANVLYLPTRLVSPEEWKGFLQMTREYMGAEWKDNGVVQKVEEIVKYCSKPADTMAAGDDEIVWLYRQTQRLKITQPLGDFKVWMKSLKDLGEKVVRVNVDGDGHLKRVKKYTRSKVEQDSNAGIDVLGEPPDVDDVAKDSSDALEDREKSPSAPANILIGMTLPQWRHSPWAEPIILVQHYNAATMSEDERLDIKVWQDRARAWWDQAGAPDPEEALFVAQMAMDGHQTIDDIREAAEAAPYKVHTCRSTVPDQNQNPTRLSDESVLDFPDVNEAPPIKAPIFRHEFEIPPNDREAVLLLAAETVRRSSSHGSAEHLRAVAAHFSASYPDVEGVTDAELLAAANDAPLWMREIEEVLPGRWLSQQEMSTLRRCMAA